MTRITSKRAGGSTDEQAPKRRAFAGSRAEFQDSQSILQQAEKYRLATAKMPLDALSCRWRRGKNRGLQAQQVSRLCEDFRVLGVAREAEENYILVQSNMAAIKRMLERTTTTNNGGIREAVEGATVLDFEDWAEVNGGEKVEVMAGQHRIEALRKYVQQTSSGRKQLWWTCHIYDKGEIACLF